MFKKLVFCLLFVSAVCFGATGGAGVAAGEESDLQKKERKRQEVRSFLEREDVRAFFGKYSRFSLLPFNRGYFLEKLNNNEALLQSSLCFFNDIAPKVAQPGRLDDRVIDQLVDRYYSVDNKINSHIFNGIPFFMRLEEIWFEELPGLGAGARDDKHKEEQMQARGQTGSGSGTLTVPQSSLSTPAQIVTPLLGGNGNPPSTSGSSTKSTHNAPQEKSLVVPTLSGLAIGAAAGVLTYRRGLASTNRRIKELEEKLKFLTRVRGNEEEIKKIESQITKCKIVRAVVTAAITLAAGAGTGLLVGKFTQ